MANKPEMIIDETRPAPDMDGQLMKLGQDHRDGVLSRADVHFI
jgi:hypothetical protein